MAEKFVGKWELVDSENFEPFLKHMGVGEEAQKVAASIKPKLTVDVTDGGNKWKIHVASTYKTMTTEFELNREFEEDGMDGRKLKSICTFENGRLTQDQKSQQAGQHHDVHIERYVDDAGRLIQEMESEGVKAKRIFARCE
ncbi:Fatty acid-binding-like protein 5 [Aphelenchoides fujianensis]|nr:Fatty acid-binding-like protein 5 [Aphelenchoides fujianensis]